MHMHLHLHTPNTHSLQTSLWHGCIRLTRVSCAVPVAASPHRLQRPRAETQSAPSWPPALLPTEHGGLTLRCSIERAKTAAIWESRLAATCAEGTVSLCGLPSPSHHHHHPPLCQHTYCTYTVHCTQLEASVSVGQRQSAEHQQRGSCAPAQPP
ncbi:hypothetical protein T440DRAFT_323681 [Plenodomus tracheiphilus IPT5]|uniref:Uncharacterized protein n=1 Tax=Plenodomus tracheiphilus IPT5 TaxID=1408161 RepID=A0A6A7BD20_9PLEO|nr:hypothetical protein T440DRAFT_323681 [Plenodomus tracheiphilus IPT5]